MYSNNSSTFWVSRRLRDADQDRNKGNDDEAVEMTNMIDVVIEDESDED